MLETQKCYCPYCGEPIELVIDPSMDPQEYIEDCFVCCRPIIVTLTTTNFEQDAPTIEVRTENE